MHNSNEDLLTGLATGKVYNQRQIVIGTFFGGVLAAAYMLAANFKVLNKPQKATGTWLFSLLFFVFIFLSAFIPALEAIPGFVFTVIAIVAVTLTFGQLQSKEVQLHLDNGGLEHKTSRVVLIGLIGLAIVVAIILIPFILQDL